MNSWRFPPNTREVHFDEKGAFVGKKEAHCDRSDPVDDHKEDDWDHVALDPEYRSRTRSRERRAKAAAASGRIPIIVRESHRCKKCETRTEV